MGSRRRVVRFLVPGVLRPTVVRRAAAGGEASPSSIPIEGRECRVIEDPGAGENCIRAFGPMLGSGANTTRHALHCPSRRSRERRASQFVFSGDPQDVAGALPTARTFLKAP